MQSAKKDAASLSIATRSTVHLGYAIARFRKRAKWTQAQLAKRAGLRQATVSKVENGSSSTQIDTIYALCAALGLEVVMQTRPVSEKNRFRVEDIF